MKKTKKQIKNINELKAQYEKEENAENILFKLDIESVVYSEIQIKEKLQENMYGINNTIAKLKEGNDIEVLKDETTLIQRLNRKNFLDDCRAENVVNVRKAIKKAKCILTKKMNETEIKLYKNFYTSKQSINEILNPSLLFLEKVWIQEENELNAISKNITKFVANLDNETKKLIKRKCDE